MTAEGVFPKVDGDIYYETDVHYASGIIQVLAGENVTAGNVIYIKRNDGKIYVSDTATSDDIRANGIALETKNTGELCYIMTRGVYKTTGLTANTAYYIGASGALGTSRNGVYVGMALSTTTLFIDILQDDRDTIGSVKAFDISMTGIPAQNVTAFWTQANGQVLADAESPLNGQTLRDMNVTQRFIRGSSTSGTTGGADTHAHDTNLSLISADTASNGSGGGYKINNNSAVTTTSTLPAHIEMVWHIKIK